MSPTANSNVNFKSRLVISDQFPDFDRAKDLLIVDKVVLEHAPQLRRSWNFIYEVSGGENLKDLERFPRHMEEILAVWNTPLSRQSRIVACGGGSVGDFAGFVASILKRGVIFEQCPSTWLAAIDSAHGGKTALNVQGVKNQVGTFYPAQTVYLVRSILATQPEERALEGLGELVKVALLDQKNMFYSLAEDASMKKVELLWRYLQRAVEIKYEIVLQDPYEQTGIRKMLNLGHTLGHVLEAYYSRSHGESVQQGLWFALEWSAHKNILERATWNKIQNVFRQLEFKRWCDEIDFEPMEAKRTLQLLAQDKKINSDEKVDFVFLQDVGKAVLQPVFAEEILMEGIRQGWVRG